MTNITTTIPPVGKKATQAFVAVVVAVAAVVVVVVAATVVVVVVAVAGGGGDRGTLALALTCTIWHYRDPWQTIVSTPSGAAPRPLSWAARGIEQSQIE